MSDNKEMFSRQAFMFDETLFNKPVKVFGTGFVGSNLTYTLSKTGFKYFFLIDPDTIKEHNLLNQCFDISDNGKNKVDGLNNFLQKNKSYDISVMPFCDTLQNHLEIMPIVNGDIIIVATDNVESRIFLLDHLINNFDKLSDTTMIFVNTNSDVVYIGVNKNNKKFLENMKKNLSKLNKDNSTDGLCGEKSSYYLGNLISGYALSEIRILGKKEIGYQYTSEILFDIKANRFNYDFIWHGEIKKIEKVS